jgi:biotin carboxylase
MTTTLILGGVAPHAAGYGYDISHRALEQIRSRGSRIVLTDRSATLDAVPELTALADEVYPLDFTDTPACVAWAGERAGAFDAVMGFREYAVQSVAACADVLGLRGNPPKAVRRVRTKDTCREHLRHHGFRQPRTLVCRKSDEAEALLHETGRVVVKPRDKANSEGVSLVTARADLAAAFTAAGAQDAPVLVETWVDGEEFSVEGLFVDDRPEILAVTQKHLAPGTFIEVGHTMPAPLPDGIRRRVCDEVDAALRVLDLNCGPFHVECWVDGDDVVLGEVHVRQGGDWIHAMLEWCRPGFELYGSWLDDLLGAPVRIPPATQAAEVRFVLSPPGTVRRVQGWADVTDAPDVLLTECSAVVGDIVTATGSNADRRGCVLAGAPTAAEASAAARAHLRRLRITVD